jgi:aldose 1-epimerase
MVSAKAVAILLGPLLRLVYAQEQISTIDDTCVLPNGKYQITSTGIRAQFVPYGASLSNLFVKDIHGQELDIVMGFDNASYYSTGPWHPHLNGVPGRYANRIRNGTFSIDGNTHHTDLNDNGGLDTLHGGGDGWDYRNWTVAAHTSSSITFTLEDPAGKEGFPGAVSAEVTYFLTPHTWNIRMRAHSLTEKTPIMLTSHTYLNLDGFKNPHTPLAVNHSLYLPHAKERIAVDNIGVRMTRWPRGYDSILRCLLRKLTLSQVPTGAILKNEKSAVFDFYSEPKQLGSGIFSTDIEGACGFNCSGYGMSVSLLMAVIHH